MDNELLNLMVDRIERQSLSLYYDNAYLGFIEGALARTILASLVKNAVLRDLGLKWIAFVPPGPTELWYVAPTNIDLARWEPVLLSPPSTLFESVRQATDSGSFQQLKLANLPPAARDWDALADVKHLYVFESGDKRRPDDISGQIVLAAPAGASKQAKLTRAVQTVVQQIRDKARLLSAAKPATLRMINLLDGRYQERVMHAIEGRELNRLLLGRTAPPVKGLDSKDVKQPEIEHLIPVSSSQQQQLDNNSLNARAYRDGFFTAAKQLGDLKKGTERFTTNAEELTLVNYCRFHGMVRYELGGCAFFLVIDRIDLFYEVLVDLVDNDVHKRESISLFLVADNSTRRQITDIVKPWKKLFVRAGKEFDIHFLEPES